MSNSPNIPKEEQSQWSVCESCVAVGIALTIWLQSAAFQWVYLFASFAQKPERAVHRPPALKNIYITYSITINKPDWVNANINIEEKKKQWPSHHSPVSWRPEGSHMRGRRNILMPAFVPAEGRGWHGLSPLYTITHYCSVCVCVCGVSCEVPYRTVTWAVVRCSQLHRCWTKQSDALETEQTQTY